MFYAVIGLAVLFVGGTAGGLTISSTSGFCGLCHEMQPEYLTWKASSHAQIGCVGCHVAAKPTNLVHKVAALGEVYLHVTKQVPHQIEIKDKIKNEVCENCHTTHRDVTPSGDLTVPHTKHIDVKGVSCVDCHAGVAHAEISERSPELAHNSTEKATLAASATPKEFRPEMPTCLQCHEEREATVNCESCHKQIKTPDTHQRTGWNVGHGVEALGSYNQCLYCHDVVQGKPAVETVRPAAAIRDNATCLECHLKRPPAHDASWALGHSKAAAGNRDACMVCHDEQRTPGSKAENVPACKDCHSSNHPITWIQQHPSQVKQKGMGECFRCHDATSCSTCHTQRGVRRGL